MSVDRCDIASGRGIVALLAAHCREDERPHNVRNTAFNRRNFASIEFCPYARCPGVS